MSRFFEDAIQVFRTATQGACDGDAPDFGILIEHSGALRIVPAAGWRPEALQAHYGARTVFQVSHTGSKVRVVGRSAENSCVLESEPSGGCLMPLIDRNPEYTVVT